MFNGVKVTWVFYLATIGTIEDEFLRRWLLRYDEEVEKVFLYKYDNYC